MAYIGSKEEKLSAVAPSAAENGAGTNLSVVNLGQRETLSNAEPRTQGTLSARGNQAIVVASSPGAVTAFELAERMRRHQLHREIGALEGALKRISSYESAPWVLKRAKLAAKIQRLKARLAQMELQVGL